MITWVECKILTQVDPGALSTSTESFQSELLTGLRTSGVSPSSWAVTQPSSPCTSSTSGPFTSWTTSRRFSQTKTWSNMTVSSRHCWRITKTSSGVLLRDLRLEGRWWLNCELQVIILPGMQEARLWQRSHLVLPGQDSHLKAQNVHYYPFRGLH